jgi:mannose-6-phosphate isomerase-like protein (cupin superfamily)
MANFVTRLVKKNFSLPDETKMPFEKGKIEIVTVNGLTVQRETLQPGWKWSTHVKTSVKTESCQKYHVKFIISGRQKIVMNDGTEMELTPGDFAIIPPGHDAWVVGEEPNILLELAAAAKQA